MYRRVPWRILLSGRRRERLVVVALLNSLLSCRTHLLRRPRGSMRAPISWCLTFLHRLSWPAPRYAGRMPQFRSFSYRTAIATAASTVGMDHAQSPSIEIATADTTQPTRNPISRRRDLFNRPRSTVIKCCCGDSISMSDKTVLVKFPVITAVETTFGNAKRMRAY
jgi:hypothetical protein